MATPFVELTERLLMDAGGWKEAKLARALVEAGRVVSANYTPPVLKGVVREGDLELRAGLKIVSKSDIENLCPCRQSRQYGAICAHSLAIGFSLLMHKTGPGSDMAGRSRSAQATSAPTAPPPPQGPQFVLVEGGGGSAPDFVASCSWTS